MNKGQRNAKVFWMNIGHLRSKEEEKLCECPVGNQAPRTMLLLYWERPRGRLYFSWGIDNWSTDLHNRIFSLPYGRHGSYGG